MFGILQALIFLRPFIASDAFIYANFVYSSCLILFLAAWGITYGKSFRNTTPLLAALALFASAILISVVFSVNKPVSLSQLYKYFSYLLLFIVAASLSPQEKEGVLRAVLISGLVISILAIYQYFFGFRHLLSYVVKHKISDPFVLDYISRKRVFFPFLTPNALGGYLAMILPLALLKKTRYWFIIPIFFALMLTKSQGALLSLFLGSIIYLYYKGGFKKRQLFALFCLLTAIAVVFFLRTASAKFHTTPAFSALMRLEYWRQTLRIIASRPLTGVGIGNFNLPFSRYAHNSYLQIWAEAGILGIAAFCSIAFQLFKRATPANAALIASCSIFLIHNLVDFTFFLPEISSIWWVLSGLIIP